MDEMTNDKPEETTESSGGYCIEIRVTADNQVSIGVEPIEVEREEGNEEDYQQVASFGEALRVAKDIYAHAGQVEDAMANQGEMDAGYGKEKM